jgi:superfamily I DNA/RNA helicase
MCALYHLDLPAGDKAVFEKQVEAVITGVEHGRVPRGQYAAILIDEGHDFEPEWFRLLVQMVDPETNSLLLLYDDAQSIYGERKRRSVSWASLGIKAAGRSTILKVNYRNTIEALDFSYHFLSAYLNGTETDSEIPLVRPEAGGRNGVRPFIRRFETLSGELNNLGKWLQSRKAAGVPYENMAVLSRFNNQTTTLQKSLSLQGIPVTQKLSDPGKVRLMTMHASKGLEFNSVVIPDLGCMPCNKATPEEEAKLLYVAMTRATEQLLISYHRESVFTRQCETLV